MSNLVYYVGVPGDGYVKIGTTKNLKSRLSALAGSRHDGHKLEVFATEDGGYDLEQKRHIQFAAARGHGEWFKLTEELQAHIDSIAARSHPSYSIGYDEGYMAALNDREVAATIRCRKCGEDELPAWVATADDEDECDICSLCNSEEADAITTVDIVDQFIRHFDLGWTAEGFRQLPRPIQRRLVNICKDDTYPSPNFKTMIQEAIK